MHFFVDLRVHHMHNMGIKRNGESTMAASPDEIAFERVRQHYTRERYLVDYLGLPLWPEELADMSPAGTRRVIEVIERAADREREWAISGHWVYDINRHIALATALKIERERLAEAEREAEAPTLHGVLENIREQVTS